MRELPEKLIERLKKIYSKEDFDDIMKGFEAERVTSFRINTLRSDKAEVEGYLNQAGIPFEIADFSEICYMIDKGHEYALKGSDLFYSGKIYVQGISSQIPAIALDPQRGDTILDVTAAPGSKTTQMAAMISNEGRIVACEKNQIRFDKLNYNSKLQGANCIETLKIDALNLDDSFDEGTFDKILLDTPCSAEGRIDKNNEKTFGFWSIENISKKQEMQIGLLKQVLPLLKIGGILIYSTCTLAPEENEEVIDHILQNIPGLSIRKIGLDLKHAVAGITEFEGKRYFPGMSDAIRMNPSSLNEGFFIAKISKDR